MSAEVKFQRIAEQPLCRLSPRAIEIWDALRRCTEKVEEIKRDLYEQQLAFIREVRILAERRYDDKLEDAYSGVRIADDGMVYQTLCTCDDCQTALQGLTPEDLYRSLYNDGRLTYDQFRKLAGLPPAKKPVLN